MRQNEKIQKNTKGKVGFIFLIILTVVAGVILFAFKNKIKASFNPVTIAANVKNAELTETDGRTNVLILGSDKRDYGEPSGNLTDTILVASIGRVDKDVVLISVPRDLWVKIPSSGGYSKINAVYATAGVEDLKKVLEDVLGIQIHYHVLVSFGLFEKAIDTLGGVDVTVDNAFSDNEYPVEGKEADTCGKSQKEIDEANEKGLATVYVFPCRYEHLSFKQGLQKMDGTTALKFARSRHGDNGEGTDFARAKRQQKIITAIKDKALSLQTLINPIKLKELYDVYSKNVDTDIDLGTLQNFYLLSQQISFDKVVSIVLDDRSDANDGGLLYHPEDSSLYGGAYVLVPKTGDYSQIHAFVQRYIFGNK
jgi:polyisoprenyl-teichoic acid--peptidoglycan teichoic acid transferase